MDHNWPSKRTRCSTYARKSSRSRKRCCSLDTAGKHVDLRIASTTNQS
jgi:hypothetical protein